MNTQHSHLPQLTSLTTATWKQKLLFLKTLTQQITHQSLHLPTQLLQTYWPHLVKEHNLNILTKAINALYLWVNTFGIRSFKVQKELIRTLISLSRMRKSEIDCIVVSIVIALITRQKQQESSNSRVPLGLLSQSQFNSLNNPTFLVGYQSNRIEEEQNQKQLQTIQLLPLSSSSILLAEVIECMKSCQKYSFLICLKVIISLVKNNLLMAQQFRQFTRQAEQIKEVIEHRKFTNNAKDKEIDTELTNILKQLSIIQI